MRVVGVAAVTALMGLVAPAAVPAHAQTNDSTPHINLLADQPSKTQEERDQEAERDRKYKDSLHKIPDAKASNDPWGGVRSDAPKTATTKTPAAAKKTKTGSTQN